MLTSIILGGAALLGLGVYTGYTKAEQQSKTQTSFNNYKQYLEDKGLSNISTKDMLGELYMTNKITVDEYKKAITNLSDLEKDIKDKDGFSILESLKHNNKRQQQLRALYTLIMQNDPYVSAEAYNGLANTTEEFRQNLYNNIPEVTGVAPPKYFDENIKTELLDIDPVHLWSGQELADLHNINYDPNHYYDLIKAGTEANKNYADFTSKQIAHAALIGDEQSKLSYLDSIRNSKADAIAKGATMGQRAAAEVLATKEAMTNYAGTQATAAQNRFNTVDNMLLADAEAKLTARNYFDNLAKSLATDSSTLYAADSELYGQKHQTNAEIFGADSALRGILANANANMYSAYVQNQAAIGATNRANRAEADDFAWVFDNALKANGGNVAQAYRDTNDYIFNRYTGYASPYDYIVDKEFK